MSCTEAQQKAETASKTDSATPDRATDFSAIPRQDESPPVATNFLEEHKGKQHGDALDEDDDNEEMNEGAENDDDDGDENEDEDDDVHDDDDDDDDEEDFVDRAEESFGMNLRAVAGFWSGLSDRYKNLLASLRKRDDSAQQLQALQELADILSVSSEDSLAGYFPTESFVKELVQLLGGSGANNSGEYDDDDDDAGDEKKGSTGGLAADEIPNTEIILLASRCLANLMEALPYSTHSVVTHGAIPSLTSKLIFIEFIDLAEQVLQVRPKHSKCTAGYVD